MAIVRCEHPFAAHLGVMLDGEPLCDYAVFDVDTEAGTVMGFPVERGLHTGERTTLTGTVRLFPTSPYHTLAEIEKAFPDLVGALVENPDL